MAVVSQSSSPTKANCKTQRPFDAQAFLYSNGIARKIERYQRSQKIFSQGASAASVMYIQEGGVKLSIVSEFGKEAILVTCSPKFSPAKT